MALMVNQKKVELYSVGFAKVLADNFFVNHDVIKGKDIASFSDIEQINFFIFENLFNKWNEEIAKLESPYFDYDEDKVQQALNDFMNALSFHISMKRDDFEPLLISAITDTIYFAVDPYSFIKEGYFSEDNGSLTLDEIKQLSKYIKINKSVVLDLVKELSTRRKESFTPSEIHTTFDEVYEKNEADLYTHVQLLTDLSKVKPLKETDLFDVTQDDDAEIEEEPKPSSNINEQLSDEDTPETLNEKFKSEEQNTLAATLQKSKITVIKSSIAIHQKYMFVNQLFEGDSQAFDSVIDELDNTTSLDEAKRLLAEKYQPKYNWEEDKKEYVELLKVVERKF